MATEFRRITFSQQELRGALDKSSIKSLTRVPPGDIVAVNSARKNSGIIYEFDLFDFKKKKSQSLAIAEKDAHELLVELCIRSHIVLPKIANKSVRAVDSRLCLDMVIE